MFVVYVCHVLVVEPTRRTVSTSITPSNGERRVVNLSLPSYIGLELPVEGRLEGGSTPSPPQFMSADAHFWVKIGFNFQSLGKISNISSTSDPPVLLGQFHHWSTDCPRGSGAICILDGGGCGRQTFKKATFFTQILPPPPRVILPYIQITASQFEDKTRDAPASTAISRSLSNDAS